MKRRLLNLLKLLSLVLALWPLGGCVYIPAADSPTRKGAADPNRLIGRRKSNKPVRPGAVTREQVVKRFGKPFWEDPERRTLIYRFPMKAGYWILIPWAPWAIVRADRIIAARFDFDEEGSLRAVRVERGGHSQMHCLGPTPPQPRMLQELWGPASKPAATWKHGSIADR